MFEGIGYLYEGNWLRDFPHEEGREVWKASNGDRLIEYQGEFYEGKKHGNGKYMHGN